MMVLQAKQNLQGFLVGCLILLSFQNTHGFQQKSSFHRLPIPVGRTSQTRVFETTENDGSVMSKEDDIAAAMEAIIQEEDEVNQPDYFVMPRQDSYGGMFANFNGYSMPTGKSGYSAFLDRKRPSWLNFLRKPNDMVEDADMNEDGYGDMRQKKRSMFKRAVKLPLRIATKALSKKKVVEPGTLILVRHGESEWNKNKTFTDEREILNSTGRRFSE